VTGQSRQTTRRLLGLALVVVSICGCSPRTPTPTPAPTPTSWTLDVEGLDAKAIPVEVIDATGLVVGARPGGRVVAPDVVGRSAAVAIDDLEPELAVHWTADICATGSTVALQPRDGALAVDIAVASPGGCDLLGHDYGVVLELSGPIGDRAVVISQSDRDARSWGVALVGSDGRRRPALVVDRSGRGEFVRPMDPAQLAPGEADVLVRPGDGRTSVVVSWVGDVCDDVIEVGVDLAGGATRLRINLANEGHEPCVGLRRLEGLALTFAQPVDPAAIDARLIFRH
jgi:hypothetical protein